MPFLIKLPYTNNYTINIFSLLANKPWSMLLHSGNCQHDDSRFDILVADPAYTLTTYNGITTIRKLNQYITSNTNPFIILQQQIDNFNMSATTNNQLPFQGGLLGIFGYDLARNIITLPNIAKQDLHLPDMAIGIYRWTIIVDHHLNKTTLVSQDDPTKLINWLNNQKHSKNQSFYIKDSWRSNMTLVEYKNKLKYIKKSLYKGDCYQVCLAQRFHVSFMGNEWIAFKHLLLHNQAPFSAFIKLNNEQSVLCFSPERFLKLNNNVIQTKPIKGTISRKQEKTQDIKQIKKLSLSTKDKSENLMIVDLLRNDIGKVALPGSIKVPKLFHIETFSNVHHMVSTITGILSNKYSITDLLISCFPGGSITGAPKINAMKIIEKLEPQRRNIWSGSIGYISCCGNMDLNIIIRTILIQQKYLFCHGGSAIMADSNDELEYYEILNKLSTILPILKNI